MPRSADVTSRAESAAAAAAAAAAACRLPHARTRDRCGQTWRLATVSDGARRAAAASHPSRSAICKKIHDAILVVLTRMNESRVRVRLTTSRRRPLARRRNPCQWNAEPEIGATDVTKLYQSQLKLVSRAWSLRALHGEQAGVPRPAGPGVRVTSAIKLTMCQCQPQ